MDEEEREMLRFGTILHDIGKIGVHEEAMEARDGQTTEQVFYQMHPLIGVSILQPIGFLQPALAIVKYHHERWDGGGFPEGLSGKDIPLAARLVAVADAFDRVQKGDGGAGKTLATRDALMEIVSRAGTAFDPEIVGKFHRMMLSSPDGDAAASPDQDAGAAAESSGEPPSDDDTAPVESNE